MEEPSVSTNSIKIYGGKNFFRWLLLCHEKYYVWIYRSNFYACTLLLKRIANFVKWWGLGTVSFSFSWENALTLTGLPFVSLVFRTLNLILKHAPDSKVENACSLPEHCTASAKTEKTSFYIVIGLAKGSQEPHRGPAGFWISVWVCFSLSFFLISQWALAVCF